MRRDVLLRLLFGALACLSLFLVNAEDPYRFFTWTVTYGTISPLGLPQQSSNFVNLSIGYSDQWAVPGPQLDCVTNDNVVVNVINKLDEPFLLTWNGIKQRKNSWQDGVLGTNCPIPPNSNFTFKWQAKDQIGSFFYFPSTAMHRAGPIPIPYPVPAGDFTLLVGDWYKAGHKAIRQSLDAGGALPLRDGILINGLPQGSVFTETKVNITSLTLDSIAGKTYKFRVSNVGLSTAFNFRIQARRRLLHRRLHPFTTSVLTATAVLRYSKSTAPGSILQARSFRWNLTANAARPNPQGSYRYGSITRTRSLVLANTASVVNGRQRYAVNGVFSVDNIPAAPPATAAAPIFSTSVLRFNLRDFVEVVFQNNENDLQSWHIDGTDFWVVAYGSGQWDPSLRGRYNLVDATTRHTFRDVEREVGMWARQYRQQLYIRVWTPEKSTNNEYDIPANALLCGRARRS
ncbi:unnamed protein product [Spirodela intermedia]|uniref:Uncharacterized protein n=1 Tax=Spirodela intermedia TaxID=51605 RepID=A0A7I8JDA3_SPIIN|nr:unnamed protein product [Spirodela intermedia]CAA6667493.1 unnamed protein product [Spirodela intermedia]